MHFTTEHNYGIVEKHLATTYINGRWGKTTQVTKSTQQTFDNLPKAKTFIQTFNMFIVNHKTNTVAEIKYKGILILKRSWPTTSYVAAMFHPTIG